MKKKLLIPFMACLLVPQYIWTMKKNETGIIEVTGDNREDLERMVVSMYDAEGCGICKKTGRGFASDDVLWFAPHSRCVHKDCFKLLEGLEKPFWDAAEKRYPTHAEPFLMALQQEAHKAVVALVEKMIAGKASSIKEYIEQNGSDGIKVIFDQVAVALLAKARKETLQESDQCIVTSLENFMTESLGSSNIAWLESCIK